MEEAPIPLRSDKSKHPVRPTQQTTVITACQKIDP
jgi:hypothetical protein